MKIRKLIEALEKIEQYNGGDNATIEILDAAGYWTPIAKVVSDHMLFNSPPRITVKLLAEGQEVRHD